MTDVYTERMFISADLARRMFAANIDNNRPIADPRVKEMVRDMKRGWKENGDTVKFTGSGIHDLGRLIDGQKRLTACIESGVGFWTLVAFNVQLDALATIDTGQTRSTGQQLHMLQGVYDYNNVSSVLSYLWRFRDGTMLPRGKPTSLEAQEMLRDNSGITESIAEARRIIGHFPAGPLAAVAACHYLFSRQDARMSEVFFDALAMGSQLREVDPVYQLRSRIIGSSRTHHHRKIDSYEFLALMFKAWLAEKEGRTMKSVIKWNASNESFPNIGPVPGLKLPSETSVPAPLKRRPKPLKNGSAAPTPDPKPKGKAAAATTALDKLIMKHRGLDGR